MSSSRVFEYLLDDRSAEVLLLGCLVQYPDYKPALSDYGKLVARKVRGVLSFRLPGPSKTQQRLRRLGFHSCYENPTGFQGTRARSSAVFFFLLPKETFGKANKRGRRWLSRYGRTMFP